MNQKNKPVYQIETTLSYFLNLKNDANRFSIIRHHARKVCKNRPKVCEKCGYSKHVEVCHLKPIKDFSAETKVREINSEENLILLCPNCHWELDHKPNPEKICQCGEKKYLYAKKCRKCSNKDIEESNTRKIVKNRPSKEELERLVWEIPMTKIGKIFSVSDNSIRKWCKKYGITNLPTAGYWAKVYAGKI